MTRLSEPAIVRFASKVKCIDGHWIWQASRIGGGSVYGAFWFEGKTIGAHVASYRLFVGSLVPGDVVHHKCRIQLCVRPMCLERTDHKGNMYYERKEVCIRGHDMTDEANIYMNGWARVCRKCAKIRDDKQKGR